MYAFCADVCDSVRDVGLALHCVTFGVINVMCDQRECFYLMRWRKGEEVKV